MGLGLALGLGLGLGLAVQEANLARAHLLGLDLTAGKQCADGQGVAPSRVG